MPFAAPDTDLEESKGFSAPADELVDSPDFSKIKISTSELLNQPSQFSSGLGADVPISENPDWAFTKAVAPKILAAQDAAGKVLGYAGNVAKAIPADVAETIAGNEKYYELKNLAGAALGEEPQITEKIADASDESPIAATTAKISQGLAASAPLLGAGALPAWAGKLVAAGFSAKMLADAPELARNLGEELGKNPEDRDANKLTSLISDAIQTGLFAPLAGLHGTRDVIESKVAPKDFVARKIAEQLKTADLNAPYNAPQVLSAGALPKDNQAAFTAPPEDLPATVDSAPETVTESGAPSTLGKSPDEVQNIAPTASEILSRTPGETSPEEIASLSDIELGKLKASKDPVTGLSYSFQREGIQWGAKQDPEKLPEIEAAAKQAQKDYGKAFMSGDETAANAIGQRAQFFASAAEGIRGANNLPGIRATYDAMLEKGLVKAPTTPPPETNPASESQLPNPAAETSPPEAGTAIPPAPADLTEPQIESVTALDPQSGSPVENTVPVGASAEVGLSPMRAGELGDPGTREKTGLAARIRSQRENAEMTSPTEPGKGIAPEASVELGRQLLQAGADPEANMRQFEETNRASSDDFAIARAHQEQLARATNQAEEKFGTDSPEFKKAYDRESKWSQRTKAMQTEWAKSGHAQQGEVDIDTGTFLGLKRAYRDSHNGEDLPKEKENKAREYADKNQKLLQENASLMERLKYVIGGEKPETIEHTRTEFIRYRGGKMDADQVRALWNYAKQNYIDKGEANFGELVRKVAVDLGIDYKDVANGMAQPKNIRRITDEIWRKQTDARRVSEDAKRWVRQTNQPALGQIVPRIARKMFGLKVFGHGGVAFGTHAPMVAFIPKYSKTYFQDFGKMYKMVFSPAEYEANVQALRADPNFNVAARAGLVNDPYKVEDFNNPEMTGYYGKISGAGNRGYFALKILRQDMFNKGWNKLPATMQTPEFAKAMASDINHLTGVVKSGSGNTASLFLFAPKLLMSRAAFLVGDPYKAIEIASTAMSPAKWKALPPEQKFIVLNQVKQKATIIATAYGLLLANKYLLQAVGSNQQINLTDPTKSDFMKFKAAGMDFSYGNAMLNMARLPLRLWTIGAGDGGKLKKVIYPDESMYSAAGEFLRSQASPMAGLGLDLIFKGDYQNRPLPQIPGYGKPIPLPKRLAAQGIKPYTWPEFFAEQALPIPLEEATREVWRNGFGMTPPQIKSLLKAAGTTIVMAGTGGRLTEDLQPKK